MTNGLTWAEDTTGSPVTYADANFQILDTLTPGGSGVLVNRVSTAGTGATGTTTLPITTSIPTNTQGTQFMSVAITPANVNNILVITVDAWLKASISDTISGALFKDSVSNALSASAIFLSTAGGTIQLRLRHIMTAGTTSAVTFKFRAGTNSAATTTFNGGTSSVPFGGVAASSMMIEEFTL